MAFGSIYFTSRINPYPKESQAGIAWDAGWDSIYDMKEYDEGYNAFPEANAWENPYEQGSLAYKAWEVGYSIGHAHGGP